jgi:protein TIF31
VNSSGFVPPSTSRKLLGDLYYLQIRTLEDTDLHITASSEGFFVNQSTQNNFNPNPHTKFSSSISLLDLLMQVSPKFKTKFQELQKGMKIT